jgi:hypothetical protein
MASERYRIHPDVAWRLVDGVVFLLTPDSRYHQNDDPVGVTVWEALAAAPPATPPDLDTLAACVASSYDVDVASAAADLAEFLAELVAVGAVERVAVEDPGDLR